jgi:hypothetical protein
MFTFVIYIACEQAHVKDARAAKPREKCFLALPHQTPPADRFARRLALRRSHVGLNGEPVRRLFVIQLLRQRSYISVKAYATISIGIRVVIVYRCMVEVHGVSARKKEKTRIRVFVLFPSITLKLMQPWTTITHKTFRHCGVCSYALIGQSFSKPWAVYEIFVNALQSG